ncbi:MAG: Fe-S-containing hydro-lyase [Desulfobacteraceae bacterium]|nr:MAG: Fe-S-containing hydro-lyase [Desulfobacteraceae bacterium]
MDSTVHLQTPLDSAGVESLRSGDRVLLSGVIYTARDAAHKRLVAIIAENGALPLDLEGQIIYYVGPTPARPGAPIGAAGPTTSYRMDPYAPALIARGLKGMIGKGVRGPSVKEAMRRFKAVYMAAIGGAGALMAQSVRSAEMVAYPELGAEAIRRLVIENMPLIVVNDTCGGDLYEEGMKAYRRPFTS